MTTIPTPAQNAWAVADAHRLAVLAVRAHLTPVEAVALPAVVSRIAVKVNRSEAEVIRVAEVDPEMREIIRDTCAKASTAIMGN